MTPTTSARLYALFEKQNGRWARLSEGAYLKKQAEEIFSTDIKAAKLTGRRLELRPVKE